jgi:peptidoglycan/LPS O-acetylase OafA/YrhL
LVGDGGSDHLADLDAGAARPLHHTPALDGVRGMAVLLVLAFHFGVIIDYPRGLVPGGFVGVDVFFVLSGFLITSLLVANPTARERGAMTRFYGRRARRLLPALVVYLALEVAYARWMGLPPLANFKAVLGVLFYLSNWLQLYWKATPFVTGALAHTWSLAIEEQFYLVWPAVLLFVLLRFARSRDVVFASLAVGVVYSACIRFVLWHAAAGGQAAAYMRTDARADGLLLGAIGAFMWRWEVLPNRALLRGAAWAAVVGVFATTIWSSPVSVAMYNGGFTVVSLGVVAIVLSVMRGDVAITRLFVTPWLRATGRVSYGLYLYSGVAAGVGYREFHRWGAWPAALAGLALTFVAAIVSWYAVERPFLRTRVASVVTAVHEPVADAGFGDEPRPRGVVVELLP